MLQMKWSADPSASRKQALYIIQGIHFCETVLVSHC